MLYILKLQHNKYYVGYSGRKHHKRLMEHFCDAGSQWSSQHQPVQVIRILESGTLAQENDLTQQTMSLYGWWNVRGGSWCKVDMERAPAKLAAVSLTLCTRCGRESHDKNRCYAKTDINGQSTTLTVKLVADASSKRKRPAVQPEVQIKKQRQVSQPGLVRSQSSSFTSYISNRQSSQRSGSFSSSQSGSSSSGSQNQGCFRCGRLGHWSTKCYAKTTLQGKYIKKK